MSDSDGALRTYHLDSSWDDLSAQYITKTLENFDDAPEEFSGLLGRYRDQFRQAKPTVATQP